MYTVERDDGSRSETPYSYDDLPSLADAASSVDALVGDEADDLATSFDGYTTTTHSHGHPEPSQNYASAGSSLAGHGHPSPEASVRRPPPGFEARSLVASREQVSAPATPPPIKPDLIQRKKTLKDEEFPALHSPTVAKRSSTISPARVIAIPNIALQGKQVANKKSETGQGLDGSRRGSLKNDNELEEKEKVTSRSAATPRTGPKTLRVMTPAKIESPSIMSPVASRILSGGQRPETPVSETVSDSASIVSASVSASRAGSPPPSKVGSAPVRSVTKSRQRKQRKDALKQDTKAITEAPTADEAIHEAITSHKKKQKKEKPAKEKPASFSTKGASEAGTSKEEPKTAEQEDRSAAKKEAQPAVKTPEKALEQTVLLPTQPQPPAPTVQDPAPEDDEPVAPPQGPSTVFADIRHSLWAKTIDKLNLLRPVAGLSSFVSQQQMNGNKPSACKDIGCKCGEILPEDLAVLLSWEPVRKQCRLDGSRVLLTPYGDCIRRLTEEEENDFLRLQRAVAATAESAGCFTSPRHQKSSGAFSIVKGRAVPNGRPNIFPSALRPESQDPFGKLQRDEALSYINQYVLPRLNLGASGKAAAAASGSLAPLRDAAAASLNSLAPYFYGPEAAAGVGIYSAVDSGGARPVHDFGAPPGLTLGGNVDMVKGAGARSVGAMALMSVDEAEAALDATRKDTEKLEKGLNAVIKKNKRLLIGS